MSGLFEPPRSGRSIVIAFALAAIVYVAMITGPLAQLEQIAGAKPFDLRPGGYSHDSARAFVAALGQEGRRVYLWRQLPLDTAYPLLFAISVTGAICWLSQRVAAPLDRWFRAVSFAAYLAAAADYLENTLIAAMLNSDGDLSPLLTRFASGATITKSVLTSVAMTALLAVLIVFAVQKTRRPKDVE